MIFYVKDSGIGIADQKLRYIFEEFYTTKQDGTGLGLSIIKEILESNNSVIEVESKEGAGTTFMVRIPLFYNDKGGSN